MIVSRIRVVTVVGGSASLIYNYSITLILLQLLMGHWSLDACLPCYLVSLVCN